jgi:F-type H+-transporting ATPase subunit c
MEAMQSSQLFLGLGYLGAGLGAGLCLFAAASGIARLASAALEGTARQPEAAGTLRTSMIIPAALIEGLAFFALVVCLLLALKTPAGH